MDTTLGIGDFSHDGLLQIVDTRSGKDGILYVTVREMIGGSSWGWILPEAIVRKRAARLARRTFTPGDPIRTRLTYRSVSEGCTRWTFEIQRTMHA